MKAFTTGPFTGRHFSVIIVAFFAVVVGVNLFMARAATSTFGGVVVENSYVASQQFNAWLDEAAKEKALGWTAKPSRRKDDRIAVTLTGAPQSGLNVSATARHPLGHQPDQRLVFQRQSDGSFVSRDPLPAGRWRLRIEAAAGDTHWRTEQDVR
ncbi:MAG: FixH family protein [Novosphingobium sp.]